MNSRLTLAGVCLLAAFGLAACGGGSGGTADTMPEPPPPTQAELDAATIAELQGQINALRMQLGLAPDADLSTSITALQDEIDRLEGEVQAAQDAKDEADRLAAEAAYKAMADTAAKLYAGIYLQADDATGTAVGNVFAAYNDAGAPETDSVADTFIMVTTGDGTAANTRALSEDKDTAVAMNHGWEGKRYTRTMPASEGTYEAIVYSNVGEPTPGDKFGQVGVTTAADGYEYGLDATGMLTETVTEGTASRVNSASFDHSAGVKEFKLGTNDVYVSISGTYHGVAGEYRCTPGTDNTCAVQVAARGFNLGGTVDATNAFAAGNAVWTFKPSNPEAQVMDAPDADYASYGWWLHKTANGATFTASAFTDEKGTVDAAEGLDDLNGTARYVGGAAGKYALTSRTGGTNDAGHFTARATLDADFTNNTAATAISGTIDQFMGTDGMPRDWEVTLKGSTIGDTGVIGNDGTSATSPGGTIWTVDGTAGAADGSWTGALRNNGDDGVPQVATGTFYSTYGTQGGEGKLIGAFGANKE